MRDPWQVAAWRFEQLAPFLDDSILECEKRKLRRKQCVELVEWPASEELLRAGGQALFKPISRASIYRWLAAYRQRGIEGLVPKSRSDRGTARQDRAAWINYAICLLYEREDRSLTLLLVYLETEFPGIEIARSTLDRELKAHPAWDGIEKLRKGSPKRGRPRPVSTRVHQVWQLDGKGPFKVRLMSGRTIRVHVLSIIDDFSRGILGVAVTRAQDTPGAVRLFRMVAALWGLPDRIQFDRGSAWESWIFRTGLALLGTHRNWVRPRTPKAQAKIESYHRALRIWFVDELPHQEVVDLDHLQDLLQATIEIVYQDHRHREMKATPRSVLGGQASARRVGEEELARAFWGRTKTKSNSKTGIVKLPNGTFLAPDRFAGKRLEFRYDLVDPVAVLIAPGGSEVPLEPVVRKPLSDGSTEAPRGTGQLQKLLDRWRGQDRPSAPPGFGLPEIFHAIAELVDRSVPANGREAKAILDFCDSYGPVSEQGFRWAVGETLSALGRGRPVQAYLDHLSRLIRADRRRNQSSPSLDSGAQP